MNDEELRQRLRRLDPVPEAVAMEPTTHPSSRARLERIMNTDTDTDTTTDGTTPGSNAGRPSAPRWATRLLAAAAAVAVVAVAGVALAGGGGDEPETMDLALPSSDVMASCLPVSADLLAPVPVAFEATAAEVDGEVVTLEVERWFAGGDADLVTLRAAGGMEALIDGFEFEVGERYLVSAVEGTVNFCGFSGPATPELTALYEDAFAG